MLKEVQYNCPKCNINFVVYHTNDVRNTHCCYCNGKATLTGVESYIDGDFIVTTKHGEIIEKRPRRYYGQNEIWLNKKINKFFAII